VLVLELWDTLRFHGGIRRPCRQSGQKEQEHDGNRDECAWETVRRCWCTMHGHLLIPPGGLVNSDIARVEGPNEKETSHGKVEASFALLSIIIS
jgi:hypothetical protein